MGGLMSLGWDPEVPAGYQDADIEMMELRERANDYERFATQLVTQLGEVGVPATLHDDFIIEAWEQELDVATAVVRVQEWYEAARNARKPGFAGLAKHRKESAHTWHI